MVSPLATALTLVNTGSDELVAVVELLLVVMRERMDGRGIIVVALFFSEEVVVLLLVPAMCTACSVARIKVDCFRGSTLSWNVME